MAETADILVVMALSEKIGRRARLTLETVPEFGISQDGDRDTDDSFNDSIIIARAHALTILGDPPQHCGFRWSVRPLRTDDVPVRSLGGDSAYGAFLLLFLQLFSRIIPQSWAGMPHQTRVLLPAIRGTALSRLAISASPFIARCKIPEHHDLGEHFRELGDIDRCWLDSTEWRNFREGHFRNADGIRPKLRSLATLDNFTACILSPLEEVPNGVFGADPYDPDSKPLKPVEIIRSRDALDAFGKVFDRQSKSFLRRFV